MPATVGLSNLDTSFFTLSSPDMNLPSDIGPSAVKSLTVTETMGKLDAAVLTLDDPYFVASRILRFGVRLDLTWGYKSWKERLASGALQMQTSDTASESLVRRGLRVFCTTPSGEGTDQGESSYTVNCVAYDWRGSQVQRAFGNGYTRGSVVAQVMAELKVLGPVIDFQSAARPLDDTTQLYQWESNFAFLARIAFEWQCFFRLAFTPTGAVAGIFVDIGKVNQPGFIAQANGGGPLSYKLEWRSGARNVSSYRWQSHEGENGTGDGGTIIWENGQPVVYKYVVQNEKVVSWRLNEDRLRQYLKDRKQEAGPGALAAAAQDLLKQQDFNAKVRYFFDQVTGNTAPQGYGVTVNTQMPGNPLIVPSMPVIFGAGFPDKLTRNQQLNPYGAGTDVTYFVREAVHTIDGSGYSSRQEIVDALTAFTQNQARV